MFCSEIRSALIRDWLPKRDIFGDILIAHAFHKILENRGRSTAVWRGPILNPNRGWEFPIFGIALALPPRTCFCSEIWSGLIRDGLRKMEIFGDSGIPSIFTKFWEIVDNLPLFNDTLFRTLTADGNAPFSESCPSLTR